ncbi:TetR family transcriptional regulator [Actinoplanes sichuanensis]|uniref:TetR/AcrR family transcriptional regulator n=1 Tax=Actinoplanes sichuanensis TaxID=512349 RepID=A0ABW4A438_9ACTN|nr:TetR/AcrR family transcriptional regulator [Actinoplanes sichuanensis]BEL03283.1 TetR family transcriptional regulator [Actinoplanes sichuanensis]
MSEQTASPSARQVELLEAAYRYALEHGLADLSLRPLAAAIGSSPRVLMFLFGNKDGLVRALLARARADELTVLDNLGEAPERTSGVPTGAETTGAETTGELIGPDADGPVTDAPKAGRLATDAPEADRLVVAAEQVWAWLREPRHRPLLRLWAEAYARSLIEPDGAWAGFAAATVSDWLDLLASRQPDAQRDTADGVARRTAVLAALRGCLLDLLATGDQDRVDAALHLQLDLIRKDR